MEGCGGVVGGGEVEEGGVWGRCGGCGVWSGLEGCVVMGGGVGCWGGGLGV